MTQKDLWISIVQSLSQKLDRSQVITWFRNTAILNEDQGVLTVGLPLPFFLSWHMSHFRQTTLETAQALNPGIHTLNYVVDLTLMDKDPRVFDLTNYFPEKTSRKLPNKNEVKLEGGVVSKMLNPRYTLENFIVASENRLAHAACLNVAQFPGQNYNPLFLYGGVGLGKTHLLQATGNEILRNDPRKVVVYVSSETFVNDVVQSIQTRSMAALRNKYRKVDTLIIDDIQFMANKDKCQEEFFHTFNALSETCRQIIISSDRPPHELTLLDERLRSRLESGMTAQIRMPDRDTRLEILQYKCQEARVFINRDVLEFMATNIYHSVRALEGLLKQVIAGYELEHTTPTVKTVSQLMGNSRSEAAAVGILPAAEAPLKAVTADELIELVSRFYTVPRDEVTGDSRTRECITPRQIIMFLAKTKLRMSLARIGQLLGNRNHTTVMHAIAKITEQLKNDPQLLRDLNAIVREAGLPSGLV